MSVILLIDSMHGVYIPHIFAKIENVSEIWGLEDNEDDLEVLRLGPYTEGYDEAWENILNVAECKTDEHTYRLWLDEDLWAIDYDTMTEEDKQNFQIEEV